MEYALAFMTGSSFSVIGLSYLMHGKRWAEWFRHVRDEAPDSALIVGMINLLLGSFIFAFGGGWGGTPLLFSILGLLSMGKGVFYLLSPALFGRMLKWLEPHYRLLIPFSGILLLLLGGAILWDWYWIAFPPTDWEPSAWNQ